MPDRFPCTRFRSSARSCIDPADCSTSSMSSDWTTASAAESSKGVDRDVNSRERTRQEEIHARIQSARCLLNIASSRGTVN